MAANEDTSLLQEALSLVGSFLSPDLEVFFMNELKKKKFITEDDQVKVNEARKRELALVLIGCLYMLAEEQSQQGKVKIGKIAQQLNQLVRVLPISYYGYHNEYIEQAFLTHLPKNYLSLVKGSGFLVLEKKHDLEFVLQGGLLVNGKPFPVFESTNDTIMTAPPKKTSAFPLTGIMGFSAGGLGLAVAFFALFVPPPIIGGLATTAVVEILVGATAISALVGTLLGAMGSAILDRKQKQISSAKQSSRVDIGSSTSDRQPGFNIELTKLGLGKGRRANRSMVEENEQSRSMVEENERSRTAPSVSSEKEQPCSPEKNANAGKNSITRKN